MNFQLKNFLILKTLKTFYIEYYKVLIYYLINSIKNYLGDKLYLYYKKNKYTIYILSDFLFFKTTNLTSNITDTVQEFNSKILIFLPLKIKNLKNNKYKIIYYLLGEIPKYTIEKNLIINGLKKTFISKLMFNYIGIFFNKFIKNNNNILYAKIIFNDKFIINIVLEENKCYCIFNNYKYDLICFLYLLGISMQDIFIFSRYNKSFYLKKLLLTLPSLNINNIINYNIFKYLSFFFNLSFKLNTYYIFNKVLNKNNSLYSYIKNFSNSNNLIALDFINILDILLDIKYNKKNITDLDLLEYRSIFTLGNYFTNQYSFYLKKFSNILHNDIFKCIKNLEKYKLNTNSFKSKLYFNLKEYLTVNPLVQYLEQINSFSEIIHKNRVTNYNSKLKQNLQIRNINLNQLGSLCLIDTTEGINCGLVISFTKNIKIEKRNNFQFPYLPVLNIKTKNFITFINSFLQQTYIVLFNNYYLRKNKLFNFFNLSLNKNSFKLKNISIQNMIYIKPMDMFSFAENLIPFIFYNDPARVLMGAKMQSQIVPILKNKRSIIITGYEKNLLNSTNLILKAYQEGIVVYVSSYKIIIRDLYNRKITYFLDKYKRSNHFTILHSKPNVWQGERIFCGQILTSTQDILFSEYIGGNNLLVSYGNFFGYNFEDAIVLNKKIIYSQLFTSLHFKVYEIIFNSLNKFSFEISTINLPKKSFYSKRNLDFFGIIKEGSKVLNNDILVSKIFITNINISLLPLYNLIYILFGKEIKNIKDKSILVSFGNSGRIVKTELFSYSSKIKSYLGYYLKCRVYICKQRLLSVGDKLCGRYGNKGIIAYILPSNDLPYTNTGIIPDIISDSLGIPSRMNIGQLFENLFGLSCYFLNKRLCISNTFNLPKVYIKTILYNYINNIKEKSGNLWIYNSYSPGKILLRDGRQGYKLSEPSFLGISKYSKLIHMIKDKIHYRTIGPYTELMQQPVKGRNKKGGQRFGEMEIWAIEAYGSSYNLRELLNYKSDDIIARTSLLSNLDNNIILDNITTTESFRTLIREIHSMNLNIEAFSSIDQLEGKILPININF
ncbi:RNA polymerase beta chain (apicoplast) [Eimeria tenella]|uniref:DNA-directed RNA polymerase subunit beta n=3 Tax=Eimeria tenella TaxID=5802 RepID=RPOB_EIMTE|nr:RNA polymerase beta chain [Eimeria tenella]Q7YN57.1 RecName: Full=DNA-directed RNA polymerase subunit beta; AltName: Full=PEP; AltName: Full=Plastid-encoded RNA polymerase subunit beta; Short=RNA polymerase subunit beta [Eimeria tenella]AAO40248.1 RNA polymerase B [Eimeria tenella]|eukprot:NP_852647.1 RNA polymerase beta chain (apicoplast) [Eimeria tenella strain Penn State]